MCGIAGILGQYNTDTKKADLKSMMAAISHRGPDGSGEYHDDNIAMGHQRLSVIDLTSDSHQPMTSFEGRYVISYNGELYNYREIREELQYLGCKFKSNGDTEVILNAYIHWKEDALHRFNGMFAFSIWDKVEKKLFLARDRYGIKPLYFYASGNKIAFASEAKSILKASFYSFGIDHSALLEYFTFQNIFTNKTFFKNISMLPSGSYMYVDGGQTIVKEYWDYCYQGHDTDKYDENEYKIELQRLFDQAVSRQLVSDVPVGSYLSGGIDSGAITAVASRNLPYMHSFTVGFDLHSASGMELSFDERERAEYMSYIFQTEHYEMVLKSGDMQRSFPHLSWHVETPMVGQSYPNYYAAKLASKFNKVVLSGIGGDELFGGYPWRYYRAVVNNNFDDYVQKYFQFWQRLMSKNEQALLFSPIQNEIKDISPIEIFKSIFMKKDFNSLSTPEEYINHSLYFEAKTFLHGLLTIEDKLSMAHSLETRVPFLDNDLVDFAMRCPVNLKLNDLGEVIRINENEPGGKSRKYFQKTRFLSLPE